MDSGMPVDDETARLRSLLRRAFPDAFACGPFELSRADWEAMRRELPLYLPADVVKDLPRVLDDLLSHHEGEEGFLADMVIYFLDVNRDSPTELDPHVLRWFCETV